MQSMNYRMILVSLCPLFVACSTFNKAVPSPEPASAESAIAHQAPPKYVAPATERFKNGYKTIFNASRTHVLILATRKKGVENWPQSIRFFIYNLEKDEIIFEDVIANGKVKWQDDRKIRAESLPGIIEDGDGPTRIGYTYDVYYRVKKRL